MDKITIIPGSVRGYGDVVSPKTLEDFLVFDSELSFEDGLYTLVYDASGVSVGLSVSSGSISVGESVVLTAEVLSGGEPVSEETVSFYDGSTLLGTDETDSDGLATYTASSLTVGSHSLTAQALDKSSSAVTVTVNKLTSTITLSVPASGTVGTSYTVSGTLVPTSGSVKLYENNVLKDTLTVSSGSFSKAITQSNEGTYSYYAVFEGSSTYSSVTSSTGSIVVSDVPPVPVVTSVSLTGDKSILSYEDSESCVLTATVLDSSDNPVEGVDVNLYNGSTLWDTLTTDSSGECSKTYSSAGSGDITFTAEVDGTLLTKTYSIEDCTYYNPNTITSITTVNISLPSNVEVSFKVKRTSDSNNYSYLEIGGNSGNTALMGQVGGAGYSQFRTYASEGSSTIDATHDTSNVPSNTETLLVWTKNGTSQSYSTGSSTVTWSDNHTHSKIKKLTILNNRVQELKVKPL